MHALKYSNISSKPLLCVSDPTVLNLMMIAKNAQSGNRNLAPANSVHQI